MRRPGGASGRRRRNVSIHARVERATFGVRTIDFDRLCFNPRTRRACDGLQARKKMQIGCFNPRTRRACDTGKEGRCPTCGVSIHARVERATCMRKAKFHFAFVSIHARVERATPHTAYSSIISRVSIHARVERATRISNAHASRTKFQSTHA